MDDAWGVGGHRGSCLRELDSGGKGRSLEMKEM